MIARVLGWTMNEVRDHTMRDMAAMSRVVRDEERKRKAAARRRGSR